jgi:hypothetical protein
MTFRLVPVLFAFLLFVAQTPNAFAQPSPTKLHVDAIIVNGVHYPTMWSVIPAGQPIVIAGWMMNCYTGMQPPWVTVFKGSKNELPYRFWPRIARPDVLAAAPGICSTQPQDAVRLPSSAYLGFGVEIEPLPPGQHTLWLRVTDPIAWPTTDSLFGTQYWQIAFTVR